MKKTKTKQSIKNNGFTLIEAMVVLFIIGLLTLIAGIGYGKANRQKMVEQAAGRIKTELDHTRDYAIFGQAVGDGFPCGYGVAVGKGKNEIKDIFTSAADLDRSAASDADKTCDELINGKEVTLSNISSEQLLLSQGGIAKIKQSDRFFRASSEININCFVVLFSAPRGQSYYCESTGSSCPPSSCSFAIFSEDSSSSNPKNSHYFYSTLTVTESILSSEGYLKMYPSGNTEYSADPF